MVVVTFLGLPGATGARQKSGITQVSPQFRSATITLFLKDLQRLLAFQSALVSRILSELPPFDFTRFSTAEKAALSLDREAILSIPRDALPANPYFDVLAAQTFLYPRGQLTPFLSDRRVGSEFLRRASQSDDAWIRWLLADYLGLSAESFKSNDRLWALYVLRSYTKGKTFVEPLGDEMAEIPSRDPDVLQDLAELLERLGRKTDAQKMFRTALLYLSPGDSQRRAILLTKIGDSEGALQQLEALMNADPQNAEIYVLSAISAIQQRGELTDEDRVKIATYYERINRPFSMLESLVIPMEKEIRRDARGNEYEYAYVPEKRRQHLPHAMEVIIDEGARIVRAFGVPSALVKRAALLQTFILRSSLIHVIAPEIVKSKDSSATINAAAQYFGKEYLALLRYLDGQCPPELPRTFRDTCSADQPLDEEYLRARLRVPEPQLLQMITEFTTAILRQMPSSEKQLRIARIVASALAWRDQPAEALALLSPYVSDGSPADVHLELGSYYTASGKYPEAIKHLKAALAAGYPDRIGATRKLARALHLNGQVRDALETLQSVLDPVPEALEAYADALSLALERKAYKTALNILAHMTKIDPQNAPEYSRKRMELLSKLGQDRDLVKEIEIYFEKTRDDQFISELALFTATTLKEPPTPAGFPLWDGWLYFHYYNEARQGAGALPIIKQIVEMLPDYIPFRERLGHLYARLNMFSEAAKIFSQLAQDDPVRSSDYARLQQFYADLARHPSPL
ncbi:MAG: tetratricopeptide repeat protein [bacterium JZ-2024 1]